MNCHEARELGSALVDDGLSADERAVVDAHLAECAECRRELDRLRQTVLLLRGLAPARAPAGFVDRVLVAARPHPWYRRALGALSLPFHVRLPLEAAALLLVGGLAVYVFQHSPELQRAAREGPPRASAPAPAPPAPAPAMSTQGTPAATQRSVAAPGSPVPPPAKAVAPPPPAGSRGAPRPATPPPTSAADGAARAAGADQMRSGSGDATPAPRDIFLRSPGQQPASPGGKESQAESNVRPAEGQPGVVGEIAKTRKAESREEDRRGAATTGGEREQKKTDALADQGRIASVPGDSAQTLRRSPAAPPAVGARQSAQTGAAAAPPPVAEPRSPLPSRDEPTSRRLERPKAQAPQPMPAEPAFRGRQEIAAGSAPAPQGGADVAVVLSVADRASALRALADLVGRGGGREVARRLDADGTVIDLLVPRAAYAEFAQGLGRLGQVSVPFQASPLPDEVRVSVRVRP